MKICLLKPKSLFYLYYEKNVIFKSENVQMIWKFLLYLLLIFFIIFTIDTFY